MDEQKALVVDVAMPGVNSRKHQSGIKGSFAGFAERDKPDTSCR
jgi:hypothetical protein